VAKVGDIAILKSGGTPSRKKSEYWENGIIRWVKTGEIDYHIIKDTAEKITPAGLENSSAKIFPSGTLIMAMYGQGVTRGKVAILGAEAATNQACVAFFPASSLKTNFLYYYFEYKYEEIRNLSHGANQKNLSADILKSYAIAFPLDFDEQDRIIESLRALDSCIDVHRNSKTALQAFFRTLLHQLMTAEIRVNDLDLAELGIEVDKNKCRSSDNDSNERE
jgi:type I restriction enzyme S subunit